MAIKELYISVDIEADGPIPGAYSMTSLGASLAGYRDERGVVHSVDVDDPANQFYTELKPISQDFVLEALRVGIYENFTRSQVDADETGEKIRQYLFEHGETPKAGMTRFVEWVENIKKAHNTTKVVFAAFPLGFDWMFTYWYLIQYAENGQEAFGHSRHIDIKTLYSERSAGLISQAAKARMPRHLHSKRKHTHKAIDDAIEQGELLMNILRWDGN